MNMEPFVVKPSEDHSNSLVMTTEMHSLVAQSRWDEIKRKFSTHDYVEQLAVADEHGSTPVHLACSKRVPKDILVQMLSHHPTVIDDKDSDGNSLLHIACGVNGSAETVRTLLEQKPVLVSDRNEYGLTPLETAWAAYVLNSGFMTDERKGVSVDFFENAIHKIEGVSSTKDLVGTLGEVWAKTTLLLLAADSGDLAFPLLGIKQWRTVHAIAANGGKNTCRCPTAAMYLALKLYPNQVKEEDEEGNLPLHLAAKGEQHVAFYDSDGSSEMKKFLERSSTPVVTMLVQKYPRAARIHDREERLPLNLAIESGKDWEEGVRALMEAAPEALCTRDNNTRLYPFMLAAPSSKTSLDRVYGLLRGNPAMVQGGIYETEHEKYLQGKIRELSETRDLMLDEMAVLKARIAALEARGPISPRSPRSLFSPLNPRSPKRDNASNPVLI